MKSSISVIFRMDFTKNLQPVSQKNFVRVLGNQPKWCLNCGEEISSSVIVRRIDNDDAQTVIELLGI